jgi:hypothetical protein
MGTTTNHPHQNALVTQMQVKTLHKQPTSHIQNNTQTIWSYRMQLWGMASSSNIEILEHFQLKALCMIVCASWYVSNMIIRRDLQTPTVKEEIRYYSSQYGACFRAHPNDLLAKFMEQPDNNGRLRRQLPNDLPTRFIV